MVAASSCSAVTGSEARVIHSSALAVSAGAVRFRMPGLNAHANSARRSTAGSGAPRRLETRATVTVASASAAERREVGARSGHLASA